MRRFVVYVILVVITALTHSEYILSKCSQSQFFWTTYMCNNQRTGSCLNDIALMPQRTDILWSLKLDGKKEPNTCFGLSSSPAIFGNYIVFGGGYNYKTMKGYVYCLNKNNGKLIWKYQTKGGTRSSPTIWEGKVYIGSGTHDMSLVCLNVITGRKYFEYKANTTISCDPIVFEGKVYFYADGLTCIDANTGRLIWKQKNVSDGLVISNKMLYAGKFEGIEGGKSSGRGLCTLYSIDQFTGLLINKSKQLIGSPSGISLSENKIFVSTGNYIYCLHSETLSLIWEYKNTSNRSSLSDQPVIYQNRVYICSYDGTINCLEINSGKKIWAKFINSQVCCPVASNYILYLGGIDHFYFLDAISGNVIRDLPIADTVFSSAAVISDKKIYIQTDNELFYCLYEKIPITDFGKITSFSSHTKKIKGVPPREGNYNICIDYPFLNISPMFFKGKEFQISIKVDYKKLASINNTFEANIWAVESTRNEKFILTKVRFTK